MKEITKVYIFQAMLEDCSIATTDYIVHQECDSFLSVNAAPLRLKTGCVMIMEKVVKMKSVVTEHQEMYEDYTEGGHLTR